MQQWMTLVPLGSLVACSAATPARTPAVASSAAAPGVGFSSYQTFAEVDPMKIDDALLQLGVEHLRDSASLPAESVAQAP